MESDQNLDCSWYKCKAKVSPGNEYCLYHMEEKLGRDSVIFSGAKLSSGTSYLRYFINKMKEPMELPKKASLSEITPLSGALEEIYRFDPSAVISKGPSDYCLLCANRPSSNGFLCWEHSGIISNCSIEEHHAWIKTVDTGVFQRFTNLYLDVLKSMADIYSAFYGTSENLFQLIKSTLFSKNINIQHKKEPDILLRHCNEWSRGFGDFGDVYNYLDRFRLLFFLARLKNRLENSIYGLLEWNIAVRWHPYKLEPYFIIDSYEKVPNVQKGIKDFEKELASVEKIYQIKLNKIYLTICFWKKLHFLKQYKFQKVKDEMLLLSAEDKDCEDLRTAPRIDKFSEMSQMLENVYGLDPYKITPSIPFILFEQFLDIYLRAPPPEGFRLGEEGGKTIFVDPEGNPVPKEFDFVTSEYRTIFLKYSGYQSAVPRATDEEMEAYKEREYPKSELKDDYSRREDEV